MSYKFKTAVITLSDKGSMGERKDTSGPKIKEILEEHDYEVVYMKILPDDQNLIEYELKKLSDCGEYDLVLTTGGTGFSKRDCTPEATKNVIDKEVPGIAEAIRAYSISITKRAMLSRAISGIRKETLIINLPGSLKAVEESLTYIIDTLYHGLAILKGLDKECGR